MASVDIVIVAVVLVSALIGLARGLFREVLSLATWVGAFLLGLYFAPPLAEQLAGQLADESVRLVAAFVAVFLGTVVAGGLLQWLVGTLVRKTGLTGTDRFLGFLFGGVRGVVVCIAALIALRHFAEAGHWWQSSVLVPELLAFEQELLELMGRAQEWVALINRE
jgi:membrane protein required for colicin V production